MNEIKTIDDYLHQQLPPEDYLLLEAQLQLNQELKDKLFWQERSMDLIRLYGRQKLKKELEGVHQQLFNSDRSFRKRILSFFKKS